MSHPYLYFRLQWHVFIGIEKKFVSFVSTNLFVCLFVYSFIHSYSYSYLNICIKEKEVIGGVYMVRVYTLWSMFNMVHWLAKLSSQSLIFMLKLDNGEILHGQRMETISITLMNRVLHKSIQLAIKLNYLV